METLQAQISAGLEGVASPPPEPATGDPATGEPATGEPARAPVDPELLRQQLIELAGEARQAATRLREAGIIGAEEEAGILDAANAVEAQVVNIQPGSRAALSSSPICGARRVHRAGRRAHLPHRRGRRGRRSWPHAGGLPPRRVPRRAHRRDRRDRGCSTPRAPWSLGSCRTSAPARRAPRSRVWACRPSWCPASRLPADSFPMLRRLDPTIAVALGEVALTSTETADTVLRSSTLQALAVRNPPMAARFVHLVALLGLSRARRHPRPHGRRAASGGDVPERPHPRRHRPSPGAQPREPRRARRPPSRDAPGGARAHRQDRGLGGLAPPPRRAARRRRRADRS